MGVLTTVVFIIGCAAFSNAFFFGEDKERIMQNPATPQDPQCVRMAERGDCGFYECFDARYPCTSSGYALKYGLYYCAKFYAYLDLFNDQGKRWVNATRSCLTRSMLSLYQQDRQSCRMIRTISLSAISDCYLETGFCEVMWDNRDALWKVYEFDELMDRLSSLRIWNEVISVSRSCAMGRIRDFIRFAMNKLGFILPFRG